MDPKIQQVFLYNIYLESGAALSLGIFAKNGKLNKHIVQIYLEDFTTFTGYGLISNNCQGDTEVITKVIHQGQDSKNHQLFFNMAGKNSQTVFQSINFVEQSAVNSEIGLECANLVTENSGRCHSKPENYIDADYVETIQRTTTHTIGLEKIGYLQSKGIPEKKAQEMIVNGFKKPVLSVIHQESLREEIKKMYSS
jgi:Fe-S cluster assembly scaffold protein SufB